MVTTKTRSSLGDKCTVGEQTKKDSARKKQKGSNIKAKKTLKNKNVEEEEAPFYRKLKDFFSYTKIIDILFTPCPPGSLGIARMMFGLMMVIDVPDERGLFEIDIRYGNPMKCHFPLFDWMRPLPLENMGILYLIMWIGAAGICLGYGYQLACIMFAIPYWYIFLLDKTTWNNHSYLYGLLSILFTFCSANHAFSIDGWIDPSIKNKPVPLWNYAILRFQFFLLYFYAGIKKLDSDWLGGHSMTRLSMHWVFEPFRLFLSNEQIDLWIIHVFGFVFDLTVGFFFLIRKTRPIAIAFSSAFHLMNSRMFHIGQFPYVCLLLTPIFCGYDWPGRLWQCIKNFLTRTNEALKKVEYKRNASAQMESFATSLQQNVTVFLLGFYVVLQLFLPFSHFITKGYNNWTNGLYGYSWDMMVHNWDSILTVIKVVDNDSGEEFFMDPEAWVGNGRFTQHGDMLVQYANCLKRNLPNLPESKSKPKPKFQNISVYIDVWCSLNGRFQQRMFDPRQDLLAAKWSPFEKITWLMPLLSDLTPWREKISELEDEITKDSSGKGIVFVADFPGLNLNNYITPELVNVSLTVLEGSVVLEKRGRNKSANLENVTLNRGESGMINSGEFHRIFTVSEEPSCYMYAYVNKTMSKEKGSCSGPGTLKEYKTLMGSLRLRLENLWDSVLILRSCLNKFLFNSPMKIRI